MASAQLLAGEVMNASAALLNDVNRTIYTYAVQVPYLNMALKELQEYFEQNNVPVTDQTSAVLTIDAGVVAIGFEPDTPVPGTTYLPNDLVSIQKVWQRISGINPYVPLDRVDGPELNLAGTTLNQLTAYWWEAQEMRFLASVSDIDLKLEYVRELFAEVEDEDSEINVINCFSFLVNRNAALVAEFVEENDVRAAKLNATAGIALDRSLGISAKDRQGMVTRRKPFRSGFKRRGNG
jgi:hypothetical protein